MIIVIGEILIDRFPEYERIGGAPFNFAYHLKNMGWPVRFLTRIGDDSDGLKIRQVLESSGFSMDDVQLDGSHPTGRVEVTLDSDGVPQFDIRENAAYDHIDLSSVSTPEGRSVDLLYYGTLIQRTAHGYGQVQRFLRQISTDATCFCDINFRSPHINIKAVEPSLRQADILKLNDEELEKVSAMCDGPSRREDAVDWLMQHYNISRIALTHGAGGSTAFEKGQATHCPPTVISHIIDTVGAGDAYASVLAAGALIQLPMKRTLEIATVFAARICELPGAIPKDPQAYNSLKSEFERIPNAQ